MELPEELRFVANFLGAGNLTRVGAAANDAAGELVRAATQGIL